MAAGLDLAALLAAGLGGAITVIVGMILYDIRRLRVALHTVNGALTSIVARLGVIEYALGIVRSGKPLPPD